MHVENGDHGRPGFLWFFVDCMFLKLFLALTTSMKFPKINETLRLMCWVDDYNAGLHELCYGDFAAWVIKMCKLNILCIFH